MSRNSPLVFSLTSSRFYLSDERKAQDGDRERCWATARSASSILRARDFRRGDGQTHPSSYSRRLCISVETLFTRIYRNLYTPHLGILRGQSRGDIF